MMTTMITTKIASKNITVINVPLLESSSSPGPGIGYGCNGSTLSETPSSAYLLKAIAIVLFAMLKEVVYYLRNGRPRTML